MQLLILSLLTESTKAAFNNLLYNLNKKEEKLFFPLDWNGITAHTCALQPTRIVLMKKIKSPDSVDGRFDQM